SLSQRGRGGRHGAAGGRAAGTRPCHRAGVRTRPDAAVGASDARRGPARGRRRAGPVHCADASPPTRAHASVRPGAVGRGRSRVPAAGSGPGRRAAGRAAGSGPGRRPAGGTDVRPTSWRLLVSVAAVAFALTWAVLTVGESRT